MKQNKYENVTEQNNGNVKKSKKIINGNVQERERNRTKNQPKPQG